MFYNRILWFGALLFSVIVVKVSSEQSRDAILLACCVFLTWKEYFKEVE